MVLEGLDGPLSRIVTMVVQRDNLEVYFPVLFHDSPEFSAHLVVDYLKFYREAFGGESLHDGIVCGKIIFVVMTGKVGVDYSVGVALVINNDIFISTESTDR